MIFYIIIKKMIIIIEAAEKVYKDYCKLITVVFLIDIIYISKDGNSMLKLNNQLELSFSKHSELYDILIKEDNFWRQLNDMIDFSFVMMN